MTLTDHPVCLQMLGQVRESRRSLSNGDAPSTEQQRSPEVTELDTFQLLSKSDGTKIKCPGAMGNPPFSHQHLSPDTARYSLKDHVTVDRAHPSSSINVTMVSRGMVWVGVPSCVSSKEPDWHPGREPLMRGIRSLL